MQFLIKLQLWPLTFLQPLDLKEDTVPHLKELIHVCSETESQGHGITFKMIYLHSRYPYFISYRGLIWKIWFISVWRLKARAMAWLFMWFMFAQSTLISYHTVAFVKTEVGCTVHKFACTWSRVWIPDTVFYLDFKSKSWTTLVNSTKTMSRR